ncbi:hypothetical protein GCM10027051_33140 [Niabella terrae]
MSRHLHIVCQEAPSPANNGEAIDMMNRIRAFQQNGIKVHLHYFKEESEKSCRELDRACESVHEYEKKPVTESISLHTPYTVSCRCNETLAGKLAADQHPILFEGLQTTGVLRDLDTGNRRICVRIHNEGSTHYRELARHTSNPAKKTYFLAESLLVKKYTPTLPKDCIYMCASYEDQEQLEQMGFPNVHFIPVFPSWQEVQGSTGIGNLCLFHGKLSCPKNEKAALWLLTNIFNKVRVPFVIAGCNPSRRLQKAAELCQNTCLVSNPCDGDMDDLIEKAHINILPSFNKNITGSRLKLLHALFKGRHCVTTPDMVAGTGLDSACHIGTSSSAIASIVSQLYYVPFEEHEIRLRKQLLGDTYNNQQNISKFISYLW